MRVRTLRVAAGAVLFAVAGSAGAQVPAGPLPQILGVWILDGDPSCGAGAYPATFTFTKVEKGWIYGTFAFGCNAGSGKFYPGGSTGYDGQASFNGAQIIISFMHARYTLQMKGDDLVGDLEGTSSHQVSFHRQGGR